MRQWPFFPDTPPSLFQSTHPCRVRLAAAAENPQQAIFQSTHPCRVRRKPACLHDKRQLHFNPRTRVGCDALRSVSRSALDNFNPRTRVGCDGRDEQGYYVHTLFQSTHPCRVRRLRSSLPVLLALFQSTHPCRVRHFIEKRAKFEDLFQSTHPCRVRPL